MTTVLTRPVGAVGRTIPALDVVGLQVAVARRRIVHDMSIAVHPGEVVGLIGRNGAGKTTTLRAILGLIPFVGGRVDLTTPRSRIGTGFDTLSALRERSAVDNLRMLGDYLAVAADPAALLTEVGLASDAWTRPVRTYSHGMKQKLSLAAALLGDPALIVLDEPHNGLDPIAVDQVGRALHRRAAEGAAVLVSSHLVDELDRLCDRVVVIDAGRVVLTGSVAELTATNIVQVRTPDGASAALVLAGSGVEATVLPDGIRATAPPDQAADIARMLVGAGIAIDALIPGNRTLTGIVREVIGGDRA